MPEIICLVALKVVLNFERILFQDQAFQISLISFVLSRMNCQFLPIRSKLVQTYLDNFKNTKFAVSMDLISPRLKDLRQSKKF